MAGIDVARPGAGACRRRQVLVVLAVVKIQVALVGQLLQERASTAGGSFERVVLQTGPASELDVHDGFASARSRVRLRVSLNEGAETDESFGTGHLRSVRTPPDRFGPYEPRSRATVAGAQRGQEALSGSG
jgi:hypothetical protein